MRLFRVVLATTFILLFSLTSIAQQTTPNSQPAPSKIRIINYGGDLLALLAQIPPSFDVTIGLEVDPMQPNSYVTLKVDYPTIDTVLEAIVKSKPNYGWRRDGRSVDVFPNERTTEFLDTRVTVFQTNEMIQSHALHLLFAQPEVQSAMKRFDLSFSAPLTDMGNPGSSVSVNAKGLTLRQLLHQIAGASGAGFWAFKLTGPRKQHFTIEMPTR